MCISAVYNTHYLSGNGFFSLGGDFLKKWNIQMLVEGGIMIALAVILNQIKIYSAPSGGSVTAGSMKIGRAHV